MPHIYVFILQKLSTLPKIMQECWHKKPSAQLTALRVKKSLQKIFGVTDN